MGGALFTLELIAESLWGPVLLPATAGIDSSRLSSAPPALGLRLLDLATELLEAPEGEAYSPALSSRVSFGGRGKALVFELPDQFLHEYKARDRPLPFWLLACAAVEPSTAGRSEATTTVASAAAAAKTAGTVLLASACVDLRQEVLHAQRVARLSSEHSNSPSLCPFRRCGFQLTTVHGLGSALTLECFFRVYAGSHIPPTDAALLQPAAVAAAVPVAPSIPTSGVRAKDCCVGNRGSSMQGPPQRDAATQTERIAHFPAAAAATALAALVMEGTQRSRHSQTPAKGPHQAVATVAQLPSQSGGGVAFFADEIRIHGGVVPSQVDEPATVGPALDHGVAAAAAAEAASAEAEAETIHFHGASSGLAETLSTVAANPTTPQPHGAGRTEAANLITPSQFSGGPPEVSPSLNLVSELVRELWQIRSISS